MHAVRRCRRRTSETATRAVEKEQTEMHVPLPHAPEKVPPYSSDIRGEALAGQRRSNIRRRPKVLGRAEPTSNLVEQSLGPVNEDWQGCALDVRGDSEVLQVTQPRKVRWGLHSGKSAIIDLMKFVS